MEAKRKRTKNIIIAAVLVAVAILMAALPAMLSSGQKEENTGTAKSVAVQRGNIDSTVAGAGTLSGGDGVKITVPHGVEITEYLVANGDVVAEGQALAAVDKTSVMNTIATVQNNLEYLAGQVRTAASGATNAYLAAPAAADVDLTAEPVVDTESAESIPVTSFDGVSVYDWDADASDWAASNPNRLAKGDLVYLVYDENGVLLWVVRPQKPEEPEFPDDSIIWGGGGGGGEAPAFEMYDRTETELMRISPMDTVSVQMLVDEMDILSVHTGQEAEITVDALPGRAFTGTVTAIDPNGKNNGGNSKYTVTITMPRAENMLDGMNAMAVLTVGTTENVLWLPAEALAEQGFKTVVYTGFDAKTGELTGPVEVVTGVSDGDKVEIVSGLEEGQTVWYIAYESAEAALFSGAAAPESA